MSFAIPEGLTDLKISLEDIRSATNNFAPENMIGGGGYGKVYRGELSLSRAQRLTVAIKRLDSSIGDQGQREFIMEITVLSSFKHENMASLVGFCDEGVEKILVYEHEAHGSLDKYLGDAGMLTWKRRLHICIGVARGLEYLHSGVGDEHRVIHRDIKSSNILLDENWRAKISDFGLSKIGLREQEITFLFSNVAGTPGFLDPLYEKTGILTKESDVYSFGVVLFEVLCGRPACLNDCDDNRRFLTHLALTSYEQGKLDDIIDPNLRNQMEPDSLSRFSTIAYACLQEQREKRPAMTFVLKGLEHALRLQVFGWELGSPQVIHHGALRPSVHCEDMAYSDIVESTNNFDERLIIREGQFGKVYKGVLRNGVTVAVEQRSGVSTQGFYESLMRKRRHKNLLNLIGYAALCDEVILVYEFMSGGTLEERLWGSNNYPPLTWKEKLEICIDVARGLNFLHGGAPGTGIIHGDVTTSSIMLDHKLVAKLADFGISKPDPASDPTRVSQGTFGYLEPEDYRQGILTVKSDVYLFGIIMMEVTEWTTMWGTVLPESLRIVVETAIKCLADEGNERPSMSDVLWNLEYALQFQDDYDLLEKDGPTLRDYLLCRDNHLHPTTMLLTPNVNWDYYKEISQLRRENPSLTVACTFQELGIFSQKL